jgi:hypothetical protein
MGALIQQPRLCFDFSPGPGPSRPINFHRLHTRRHSFELPGVAIFAASLKRLKSAAMRFTKILCHL